MSERWQEYYTREQLRKLQNIELKNLRVLIEVCEKLDIQYFLYGGTLLGAEKYKGFVPWDDDIDIAMPRESYEKFLELAPEILPEDYFLQTPYNSPKCPYPYTKMRKRGTRYVEYVNRNLDIESGIYIDIYPVDRIPDDERLRKKQFRNVRKWIFIYVCRQTRLYDKAGKGINGFARKLIKWIICNTLKVFPQNFCMKKIDYYMTMFNENETKRYAALNSPNYNNIYEELYPLVKGVFEEQIVNLPGDYKSHLRKRYGDYSLLPNEEERYGHIPYILDLGD